MAHELILAPAIADQPLTPTISGQARRIRQELLDRTEIVPSSITHVPLRDVAISIASDIKGHIDAVEKMREEIKRPFLEMGRAIDAAAKEHVAELKTELNRLNGLVGAFNEQQAREAEQERRKLAAEAARIENERRLAEQEAIRIEQNTPATPPESLAGDLTPVERAKALARLLADEDEQAEKEGRAQKTVRELAGQQAALEKSRLEAEARHSQSKPSGGAQRHELDIEVTDIHLLRQAHPACVKLTPDLVAIKYVINTNLANGDQSPIPGVTYFRRAVFSARGK